MFFTKLLHQITAFSYHGTGHFRRNNESHFKDACFHVADAGSWSMWSFVNVDSCFLVERSVGGGWRFLGFVGASVAEAVLQADDFVSVSVECVGPRVFRGWDEGEF